jgi:hypothetical protein
MVGHSPKSAPYAVPRSALVRQSTETSDSARRESCERRKRLETSARQ